MIERYTLPALREIWTDERRYALWTRVEVAVCRALADRGVIPRQAFETPGGYPRAAARLAVLHSPATYAAALGRCEKASYQRARLEPGISSSPSFETMQ